MNSLDSFPPAIRSLLRAFVARRRFVLLLRGMGMSVAVGLSWILVFCLADRIFHLPTAGRWIGYILCICLIGITSVRCGIRAMRKVDWVHVAEQIETCTSRFEQRLTTVVSQCLSPIEQRGSTAMLLRTQDEAELSAANSDCAEWISWRLALTPWMWATGIVAVFAALWPITALDMPRLVSRFIHPMRRIDPVTLTRLEVSPRGAEISAGESITIAATVATTDAGAPMASIQARGVDLYLSTDGHTWSRAAMNAVSVTRAAGKFTFPLPGIDRDLQYYVRGGDARSEQYQIKVKRIPTAVEFRIRYVYPLYTGHAPVWVTNSDGLIESLTGCEATIWVTSTEPLSSATLIVDDRRFEMNCPEKLTQWQVQIPIAANATCILEMKSIAGVAGRGPTPMLLKALPDREPAVVIQQPVNDLRLGAADAVTLHYNASDDYGLKSLEAVVRMNDATAAVFPVLFPFNAPRREGDFTFDLSDLQPKVGDVISLSLRAEDFAGHQKRSEPRQILISPFSAGVKAYARAAELKRAARLAALWAESLNKAREAINAARSSDPRSKGQEAWSTANRALTATAEAAAALRQALLRALIRSESPALATTLANWIDETSLSVIDPGRPLSATARNDNTVLDRLLARWTKAKEMTGAIATVLQGEQAAIVETERRDIGAVVAAPPEGKIIAGLRAKAVERARVLIDEVLRELALNAMMPGLDGQLRQRIDRAKSLVNNQKPVNFGPAVVEWSERLRRPGTAGSTFPLRLQAASQSEAMRADGDLGLARDLQFSARLASQLAQSTAQARDAERGRMKPEVRAKLFEPVSRFERAFNTLIRDRAHAGEARSDLAQLDTEAALTESIEELAFEAGAIASRHSEEAAAKLDAKMVIEVGHSSQDESRRFQEDLASMSNRAAAIDRLIENQRTAHEFAVKGDIARAASAQAAVATDLEALLGTGELVASTQPSVEIHDAPEFSGGPAPSPESISRNPLTAAAWHARAASVAFTSAVQKKENGLAQALARQQDALGLLNLSWERVIHRAAQRRLEEVPALANLFQPYAPDEGAISVLIGGWPRYGTRFHETFRARAGAGLPRDSDPAGYQDQLRAYFDAVTKAQQGRR